MGMKIILYIVLACLLIVASGAVGYHIGELEDPQEDCVSPETIFHVESENEYLAHRLRMCNCE